MPMWAKSLRVWLNKYIIWEFKEVLIFDYMFLKKHGVIWLKRIEDILKAWGYNKFWRIASEEVIIILEVAVIKFMT